MTTYTEQEAREKWCPFARVVEVVDDGEAIEGFPVGNRSTQHRSHPHAHCIASDCMAWRKSGQIGIGPNGEKRYRDMDGRTRWVDVGYCGLAGKVQP